VFRFIIDLAMGKLKPGDTGSHPYRPKKDKSDEKFVRFKDTKRKRKMGNLPLKPPDTKCNARNIYHTKYCQHEAGWGTDHLGQGRCKLHGGSTPRITGRYSVIDRARFRELIDVIKHAEDRDPLDLIPELELQRAILIDFIERYDEFSEALIAWHASWGTPNPSRKPHKIVDIADASRIIRTIADIVDKIQKHRQQRTISLATFKRIMEQVGLVVAKHVKDEAVLVKIEADWDGIQIDDSHVNKIVEESSSKHIN